MTGPVAAVIPALDEAGPIVGTLRGLADLVSIVVVVDGGSTDGTPEVAAAEGAHVVVESRRGYGRACMAGLREAERLGATVAAVVDAGGTTPATALAAALGAVCEDGADLALGNRAGLRPLQAVGNHLVLTLAGILLGAWSPDLGPPRVLRLHHLDTLDLRETGFGWPTELLVRAHRVGLTVVSVPTEVAPRRGRSKISGRPVIGVLAGAAMLRTLARLHRRGKAGRGSGGSGGSGGRRGSRSRDAAGD